MVDKRCPTWQVDVEILSRIIAIEHHNAPFAAEALGIEVLPHHRIGTTVDGLLYIFNGLKGFRGYLTQHDVDDEINVRDVNTVVAIHICRSCRRDFSQHDVNDCIDI